MRFLADESCDFSVVRALRSAEHDVVAIAEVSPRADDDDVRERAVRDERILVTEDKDFGQLVYASMRRTGGVIFIRFPARARRDLLRRWSTSYMNEANGWSEVLQLCNLVAFEQAEIRDAED